MIPLLPYSTSNYLLNCSYYDFFERLRENTERDLHILRMKKDDNSPLKDFECHINANTFELRVIEMGHSAKFIKIVCKGVVEIKESQLRVSLSISPNYVGITLVTFFVLVGTIGTYQVLTADGFDGNYFYLYLSFYILFQLLFFFERRKYIQFFKSVYASEISESK